MELKYNVTGSERKRLVAAIAEITGATARYLGAPSFAYEVDYFIIDKSGTVSFDDRADSEVIERLIDGLADRGYNAEMPIGFTLELPREGVSDTAVENLRRLVDSKSSLIMKALGADRLNVELTDDRIILPRFDQTPEPDMISAFAHLAGRLLAMAKSLHRVNATDRPVENERYAFRCFLLRLGFIGAEYKRVRRTLLKNLSGNTAFKTVKEGDDE